MIDPSTLSFLKSLRKHNNKEWFDANRKKYEAAKENFETFVKSLLEKMISLEPDFRELSAKECIFRINRDIRFSKNKTPYKVSRSANFSKGGKKSIFAGYYIHVQPDGHSFVGGGLWMPEPATLKKIRQEIDYSFPEFKKIIAAPTFKNIYGGLERDENQMLVNVPKGYDKENPAAEYLRMKSFVATKDLSDKEVLDPKFENKILQAYEALTPLIQFLNRALE